MSTLVIDKKLCQDTLGPDFGWFEKSVVPVILADERNKIEPGWFSQNVEERHAVRRAWAEKFQPDLLDLEAGSLAKFLN